jgi:hypothetical protein
MKLYLVFVLSVLISLSGFSQGTVTGYVRDALNNKPVAAAEVRIDQIERTTITDSLGRYTLTNIPFGSYSISVRAVSYDSLRKFNVPVTAGNSNEISFELTGNFNTLSNVTVISGRARTVNAASLETPLSVQRLTTEEIKSSPGSNFDISRTVQSLPGISGSDGRGIGYRNDIIIRGGAPNENVYYLDGIEIPVINHFSTQGSAGGPQGILNVSFIEDVRVSTAAFDAKYDNALSGVFEFKQKKGNIKGFQGNIRLSASEFAATFDGPLDKNRKLTFLASARRSYLKLLFKALDLPIRPDYYDFQYKLTYTPNEKNTFSVLGIGAIDKFEFGTIRKPTQEKYLILNNAPSNNQWNYTIGGSWKRSLTKGSVTAALSRNVLNIDLVKYDENNANSAANLRLRSNTRETENKLRIDVVQTSGTWKFSYGINAQYVEYFNNSFIRRRAEIKDASGNIVQPADIFLYNTNTDFYRYGSYVQIGNRFANGKLVASVGIRTDGNSFLNSNSQLIDNLSPRISASYLLAPKWKLNATAGRYTKMPPYTILGFQTNSVFVNRNAEYVKTDNYAAGVEYLPSTALRFTVEAFYKNYNDVPVSLRDGISLNNSGADFLPLGNEPIVSVGKGRSYGFELFAQKKLTDQFFGFASYTFVVSKFSGLNGLLLPSAWDNRHLASFTLGYKFKRSWELGLKFRYQGGLPYTPYDEVASRRNYATFGSGIFNYTQFNTRRLKSFVQGDVRVDKKWNFRKLTIDLFFDVQNFTAFASPVLPQYLFERDLATGAYRTTNGQPLQQDGSNAIPNILTSSEGRPLPTIGFIVEF